MEPGRVRPPEMAERNFSLAPTRPDGSCARIADREKSWRTQFLTGKGVTAREARQEKVRKIFCYETLVLGRLPGRESFTRIWHRHFRPRGSFHAQQAWCSLVQTRSRDPRKPRPAVQHPTRGPAVPVAAGPAVR